MLPAPSKLERYLSEHVFHSDYCLCLSDCDPRSISTFLSQQTIDSLSQQPQSYQDPKGFFALREALSHHYLSASPNALRITHGASEAIWLCMHSLLSLGDSVIVQFPTYPALHSLPSYITNNTTRWMMDERHEWALDLNYLADHVTAKTRLIVLSSPNNPTGHLLSPAFLKEVIHIARKYDAYVVVDEVYAGLNLQNTFTETSIIDLYEKGIAIGSFSKLYGLAGIRVGWLATHDQDCLAKIDLLKGYTSICGNPFAEATALSALHKRDLILSQNLLHIRNNLNALLNWSHLPDCPFDFIHPMAGSTIFAKMKQAISAKEYCQHAQSSANVLLAHGDLFDMPDRYIRLGLGRSDFCIGLNKLKTIANIVI